MADALPPIPEDERVRIFNAGKSARLAGFPKMLNPHRDPVRRSYWDAGYEAD